LFEIGKGHVIAFNILNMGRYKLAGNAVGNCKQAIELAAQFAVDRVQFGKSIAEFGLIKEKLGEMATRTYVAESMLYRTGGLLDEMMHSLDMSGPDGGQVAAKGIEEYALECSINKVFATEVQGYVMDEGVQIHGGYGVTSEYPIERLYRDCRVYRIFEGTNEINRTVITSTLVRRGLSGQIPLKEAISEVNEKLAGEVVTRNGEAELVQAGKEILLYTLGAVLGKYGKDILKYQEIVGKIADMCMRVFGMESAWLRAQKAAANYGEEAAKIKMNMAKVFINTAIGTMVNLAKEVMAAIAEGDELKKHLANIQKLSSYIPADTIAIRQEIASAVTSQVKYVV